MHTIVMTGASRGIGEAAAEKIARENSSVHLVTIGRDADDGTSHVEADLSSIDATVAAGRRIGDMVTRGEVPPLHGFVGNAGIQYASDLVSTVDGLEATFAVNVVANYLLIDTLRAVMTPPARVVITVSDTHFGDLRHNLGMIPAPQWREPKILSRIKAFDRPDSAAAGRTAYSTSKLAAVYLVHALARRMPDGVDVVSFNPGFVPGTGLARDAGPATQWVVKHALPLLKSTPLATSIDEAGDALANIVLGKTPVLTGEYVDRRRTAPSSNQSYDRHREDELWDFLATL